MNCPPISRRSALAAAGCATASMLGLAACDMPGTSTDDDERVTISDHPAEQEPETEVQPEPEPDPVEELMGAMTLEQKVGQLFMVTPEQLTGVEVATIAGSMTREALSKIPVGGLIYFAKNLSSAEQVVNLLEGTVELARDTGAGIPPLLGIDEEGGPLVARVANSGLFDVERFPNMAEIGATGDPAEAAEVGRVIGTYLHEIGFNLDFAPDADVLTNPSNTAIGQRSFGSDPELVAEMVAAEVEAMLETGTLPCVKHFPGHGDTAGDSHTGAVTAERSREEIEGCEFAPFRAAIEAGCPFVMVGHIQTPNFAADGLPASLSSVMMTDVLRGDLGFEGVIISDSFAMGAITEYYQADDAAFRFFEAGGDLLLMSADLDLAYQGILDAVSAGSLTEERIDESVRRILTAKKQAGLIG
ncbi:glycoside hydrolase family 3 protein [Enorma sp.]|uniref:glycoside hydrolase family 3 protein n=1 Tax=Enorma sp. TaxID=1920692 RepID=UPI0025C1BF75|nr:glycoside hydrolase family 3 protein [Enorma sp.]